MLSVQNIVIDHGKIHIVDGYFDGRAFRIFRQIKLFGIDDLAGYQAGQLLLHNIINRFCKILVYAQVDIRSRLCLLTLQNGDHLTGNIHHYFLTALGTLQRRLHIGFHTALTYHIIDSIGVFTSAFRYDLRV